MTTMNPEPFCYAKGFTLLAWVVSIWAAKEMGQELLQMTPVSRLRLAWEAVWFWVFMLGFFAIYSLE